MANSFGIIKHLTLYYLVAYHNITVKSDNLRITLIDCTQFEDNYKDKCLIFVYNAKTGRFSVNFWS